MALLHPTTPWVALCVFTLFLPVPPGAYGADSQAIHINVGPAPGSLDPAKNSSTSESRIVEDLFDGLVNTGPTGKSVPGLATKWEQKDPTTWVFTLRSGATFSSHNTPVTAKDVVFSLQRLFDPKTAAPAAGVFAHFFANGEAVTRGQAKVSALGVQATDGGKTVTIKTAFPVAVLPDILTHAVFRIVPQKVVEAHGDSWARPGTIVGSGPFVLGDQTVNGTITLVKNPSYWDAASVALKSVVYHTIESQQTEWQMYRNGQLHITNDIVPSLLSDLSKTHSKELHVSPRLMTYFYSLKHTDDLLKKQEVRRALAMAVNRKLLAAQIPNSEPSYSFMAEGVEGATSLSFDWAKKPYTQLLAEAKDLLKKAKLPQKASLSILVHNDVVHKKVALMVAQNWRGLGIDVKVETKEFKAVLQNKQLGDFQVARTSWLADYNFADTFANLFTCTRKSVADGYCNPRYDQAVAKAILSENKKDAETSFNDGQRILLEDVPAIPLLSLKNARLVNPRVQGYNTISPLDRHPAKYLSLKPAP